MIENIEFSAFIVQKHSVGTCTYKEPKAMLPVEVYFLPVKNARKRNIVRLLGNPIKSMSSS